MNYDFRQTLNSLFDVLHLNSDGVDDVIDEVIDALTLVAETTPYPEEALNMVKKRAEAIREAVKNNPLPAQPTLCKPLVQ